MTTVNSLTSAPTSSHRNTSLFVRLGLALALVAWAPSLNAQTEYCETNGLIVFEVEDSAPLGSWSEETQYSGFAGSSYFRWNGGDQFNNPGLGTLTYVLNITNPGDYQMRIHNHHNDPDSTMENDCWARMDGGTWVKVYSGQNNWNWISRFEYANGNKEPAHYNLSAGQHIFQISGRSQNFRIDRVHFFLSGNPTSTSVPTTAKGSCNGPSTHPDHNPHSVTGVFSDGTLGPFTTISGNPVTLPDPETQASRYLALADNTRLLLPSVTYTDQDTLVRIRKGMPEGAWAGVMLRAAGQGDDFGTPGGTQSMVYVIKQNGTGQVRVNIHDGTTTVFSGPYIPLAELDNDVRGINMRVTTSGNTVYCTLNGIDALGGGYSGLADPAAGGYTSLRTNLAPGTGGEIGIDYFLSRKAGDIPDLHFDNNGKLWMSALEDNLVVLPTWQPSTFVFEHQGFMFSLTSFASLVFPFFDYLGSDDDHFVLGVVATGLSLPVDSDNVFEYKGQREGEYQPAP